MSNTVVVRVLNRHPVLRVMAGNSMYWAEKGSPLQTIDHAMQHVVESLASLSQEDIELKAKK